MVPKDRPNPLSNRLDDLVQWNIRTPEWIRERLSLMAFYEGLSRDQFLRRELHRFILEYEEMYGPLPDEKDGLIGEAPQMGSLYQGIAQRDAEQRKKKARSKRRK